MAATKKAKNFQLTLFEICKYSDLSEYLHHFKSLNYLISAKETCPDTGRKHIHIYVQYNNSISLKIDKLCTAHVEKCRGSPQQNYKYVTKDGEIIEEFGELRCTGGNTIKNVLEMTQEQRAELPIQYYNIVNKINTLENNRLDANQSYKNIKVIYYWGLSGSGKTRTAIEYIKKNGGIYDEVKFVNGFWNGIGGSDIALYDDFRDSHMSPSEFINFIDYYIHNLNIKGGNIKNNYKTILITSIQDPHYLWPTDNNESSKQWLRRMEVIEIRE